MTRPTDPGHPSDTAPCADPLMLVVGVHLVLANDGVLRDSPAASMAASRRLLAYFLRSCPPTDGPPLPPPAPLSLHDLYEPPHRTG
ncbi:hypothetical protein ACIQOW_09990 [Kitasatospora sp. NPDC091335]|uniref:hypothetical protein n=1 Tax=Kitasatospora sp. NPDC091335 TaxID=3364085 RepID=UPI00382EB935